MNRARWSGYYHGSVVGGLFATAGIAAHFGAWVDMTVFIVAATLVFARHIGKMEPDAKNTTGMGRPEL
jgi:hypothetical protein